MRGVQRLLRCNHWYLFWHLTTTLRWDYLEGLPALLRRNDLEGLSAALLRWNHLEGLAAALLRWNHLEGLRTKLRMERRHNGRWRAPLRNQD